MELPRCANYRNGDCPRSEVKILKEADEFWLVGCINCGSSRVLSKPRVIEAAQYQAEKRRLTMTQKEKKIFMSFAGSKPSNLHSGFILRS